ncbi:metallophosphoesterase [Oceanicella actignis]|uniref:metallophosphoesterase n=1 Tax=Oceanicella actignis TaxID=1189325 RepID=UPI0011E7B583|nr:metallophosphoesterase [Oceanicella actignis]TYO91330.1 3',5'-cyclic AMP phosphodiesterase CpdA [Oceanicella actignis]
MSRIVLLCDSHIRAGEAGREAAARLALAAAAARRLAPDLIVHAGDLADDGAPESYAMARRALAGAAPLWILPGNHDERGALAAAFPEAVAAEAPPFLCGVRQAGRLRLVGLDTLAPGQVAGRLTPAQAQWLRARLAEMGDEPWVLIMHHPPCALGMPQLDRWPFEGADELLCALAAAPRPPLCILCAHAHGAHEIDWRGLRVSVSPPTGPLFAPEPGEPGLRRHMGAPMLRAIELTPEGLRLRAMPALGQG